MPIPIREALTQQEDSAIDKAEAVRRRLPQYMLQSVLAGSYVGVAVVLMIMVSSPFIKDNSAGTKLVQGAVFGVALTLVVFAGAELFTGCVMTMVQGLMARRVNTKQVLGVLLVSLLGNFIGAGAFAAIVAASGVINGGAPKNDITVFFAALGGMLKTKAGLGGLQLFWRATLCNFLVCLGLWMAQRSSSDAAKLICLWWALLAFVASGFEHSVANMTLFFVGIFTHAPYGTWHNLLRNLSFTVPGNILGGGLMVGAAYAYAVGTPSRRIGQRRLAWVSEPEQEAAIADAADIDRAVPPSQPDEPAVALAAPRRRTSPPPRRAPTNGSSPGRPKTPAGG